MVKARLFVGGPMDGQILDMPAEWQHYDVQGYRYVLRGVQMVSETDSPWKPCPRCSGLGYHEQPISFGDMTCRYCGGAGQVYLGEPQHR